MMNTQRWVKVLPQRAHTGLSRHSATSYDHMLPSLRAVFQDAHWAGMPPAPSSPGTWLLTEQPPTVSQGTNTKEGTLDLIE